jgi:hypothetical protein
MLKSKARKNYKPQFTKVFGDLSFFSKAAIGHDGQAQGRV